MKDVFAYKFLLQTMATAVHHALLMGVGVANKWIAPLAFLVGLLGSAQAQTLRQIQPLGAPYSATAIAPLSGDFSRLTLYRSTDDLGATAISVYINRAYHTSLLKGGYTEVCIKPGAVDIGFRRVEKEERVRNPILSKEVVLQRGEQQFLQLSDLPSRPLRLLAMPADQVPTNLVNTRQQQHTLSRAAFLVPCDGVTEVAANSVVIEPVEVNSNNQNATMGQPDKVLPPVTVLPEPVERKSPTQVQLISWSSDALFPFGKSGMGDMMATGQTVLDDIISRIRKEFDRVELVKVLGHSDAIGSSEQKQSISSQRAQTVRDYLMSRGLKSEQFFIEGRSDKEPVVSNCGSVKTAVNILCNKPNRRVTIDITGVSR